MRDEALLSALAMTFYEEKEVATSSKAPKNKSDTKPQALNTFEGKEGYYSEHGRACTRRPLPYTDRTEQRRKKCFSLICCLCAVLLSARYADPRTFGKAPDL